MSPLKLSIKLLVTAALCVVPTNSMLADEVDGSRLLPETTVGYFEFTQPGRLIDTVLDHPLNQHIQAMDVFQKATMSEGYRSFLTGRKFVELQIGSDWRPALEALTAGGIYGGFDSATNGAVLLIRGKDETTMENFRAKILEMTRLRGDGSKPDDYRDISIYKTDNKSGAAVVRDWLIVTNNGELGKGILDRLLDAKPEAEATGTLSANKNFQAARSMRAEDSQAWAFGDLQAVRDAGGAKQVFEGKADNPLAELLLGGIQSTLQHAPYVTAGLNIENSGLLVSVALPWQGDWIPEHRTYFFGPDNSGSAPALPVVSETVLTLATYRNISDMWLRAGDLFDEQMNDKLAEADSNLSTVFAGRDFGEEILGSFEPQIGIVVTRQSFADAKPVPTIKLPAFALVTRLRDPETMRSELRRTFQSAIGFFNIVGAQQGNPQLEMDMQKVGDVDLITSRYLPEKNDKDSTSAPIIFNFSPSVGFAGDRFVLASTAALAKQLAEAPANNEDTDLNTSLVLNAPVLNDILNDNREQLISQNMLQDGHSRDEAEAAIDLLLEIVRCFKGAGLSLDREGDQLALKFHLDVNEQPGK